jgi:predicted methyltransferase
MMKHSIPALAAAVALAVGSPQALADHHDDGGDHVKLSRSILDAPGRAEDDKKQDAGRKPLEVYEWLSIGPGMTVADVFCSGGYNTTLLSHAVGERGKVYAVLEFYAEKELFDGRLYKVPEVEERVKNGNLKNVEIATHITEIPAASVDAMIIVRNYHDVEWVFEGLKRADVLKALYDALKPGGVIGIVEAATPREGWDKESHRLNEKVVIEDFEKGGFELAGRSDMLANPDDDHTKTGFQEGRYNMDRYLLKFRKPGKGM